MPTYDVTFRVKYDRSVLVDADDEDSACERAADMIEADIPSGVRREIDLYSCEEKKRKDDDA